MEKPLDTQEILSNGAQEQPAVKETMKCLASISEIVLNLQKELLDCKQTKQSLELKIEQLQKERHVNNLKIAQQEAKIFKLETDNAWFKRELVELKKKEKFAQEKTPQQKMATNSVSKSKSAPDREVTSSTNSPLKDACPDSPSSANTAEGMKIVEGYTSKLVRTLHEMGIYKKGETPEHTKSTKPSPHISKIPEKENNGVWMNSKRKSPAALPVRRGLSLSSKPAINKKQSKLHPFLLAPESPGRKFAKNKSSEDLFPDCPSKKRKEKKETGTNDVLNAKIKIEQKSPDKDADDSNSTSDLLLLPTQPTEVIEIPDTNESDGFSQFLQEELKKLSNDKENDEDDEENPDDQEIFAQVLRDDDETFCAEAENMDSEFASPPAKRSRESTPVKKYIWACQPCKLQYEKAYHGNDDFLTKMSAHCREKHQKRKPVYDTPVGYWMPTFPKSPGK